ncbi:YceI family protein [Flavobacterium agricola]|uniref:YceI family protein n=1 Tax=Flavobacterium agricola TaxID=2870839 RepID=A0ABY6LZI5_9FLAO|nr:YceI family protein [Flavobacterium agricola]UYW01606.1 YceI family protein [Flavobacterium agricola]
MKFLKPLLLSFLVVVFFTATANAQRKQKINLKKSKIEWTGKKLFTSHNGTISFKSGILYFSGKIPVGGDFVVDMQTINTTDLKGKSKDKLDTHLKSNDFFDATQYPESSLVFRNMEPSEEPGAYFVTADLTIKGITHPINFELRLNKVGASATLVVNRTLYDIKYASTSIGMIADKAISDGFELNVAMVY